MLPLYFCPEYPFPHICPESRLPFPISAASPLPLSLELGPCPPCSYKPRSSGRGLHLTLGRLPRSSLAGTPASPSLSSHHRSFRARHQTHSSATLGAGMIWGAVGCEVGGHSCSRFGPRAQPREILRATASAERATSLLPAGGRGARAERCRPPARLASCLPGPWASSGAPCPQPGTHRPFPRGQPRVSATQALGVSGTDAGKSLGR